MSFRLRVTAVQYDSLGETILTGVLESGQIGGGDPICIPTADGKIFQSVVTSLEGPGPGPPPFRADQIGKATLIIGVDGAPPNKNLVVPDLAADCLSAGEPNTACSSSTGTGHIASTTLPPNIVKTLMARMGFGIAALASLAFAVWFLNTEIESPGLSFAVALIAMPMLAAVFGFTQTTGSAITKDAKGAGLAAFVIALLGVWYIGTIFGSWLSVSITWLALHVPMIIGIAISPTPQT